MGIQISPWEGAIWGDTATFCHVLCKSAEPIYLPFGFWTQVGRRMHKFSRIRQVVPMCPDVRTHFRRLANTTKPSVCGDDTPYVKLHCSFLLLYEMMFKDQ